MMQRNPHMVRAEILLGQNRFDLAEPELRQALALEPDNAHAHVMLAICLREAEKFTDATMEARTAVGLAPEEPEGHYVLASVFAERHMPKEAMAALGEAIRLDPGQPRYWGQLAMLHIAAKKYKDALAAAERGLAIDPENSTCINARAVALRGLGETDAARDAVASALARNPESAISHANMGWNMLHQSKPREALEHFREALRLRPDMEWARQGIVEALKARWLPYRLMLRYFLFMARLPKRTQWIIIVGGYVGYQFVRSVSANNPALAPYLRPLIWGYIAFAVSTWLAMPLFNLLLRLNRFGRMVLSRRETIAANLLGVSLAMPAGAAVVYLCTGSESWNSAAWLLVPQVASVAMAGMVRRQRGAVLMWCWAAGVELYTAVMIGLPMLVPKPPRALASLYETAIMGLVIAGLGSVWVANIAASLPEKRRD